MAQTDTAGIEDNVRTMFLGQANSAVYLQNTERRFGGGRNQTSSIDDLERAIMHAQGVVKTTPLDHPDRASRLNNLGNRFGDRYTRTGSIDDLEQAILRAREAAEATPLGHPDQAMYSNNLGVRIRDRYNQTGCMDDLEQAIAYGQKAVEATPLDHPNLAMYLNNLGDSFGTRYSRTGNMDDLQQAFAYAQEAVQATPPDHPDRTHRLNSLGLRFGHRYSRTGSMDDLEQAIAHTQEVVGVTALDDPDRAMYLNNLNNRFGDRYNRTGSMDDLQRAIAYAQEAVEVTPLDHPNRAMYLNNLGIRFGGRYSRTGSMDNLQRAIAYAQEAVEVTPLDHPNRAMYLNNLGIRFGDRYSRTGSTDDLQWAIVYAQEAVEATPLDHPDRVMYLHNLGNRFEDRYRRTSSIDDLRQAFASAQEAVEATPLDHPDRAMYLCVLGSSFGANYSRTSSMDDLEQAIAYGQKAVEATPLDHPKRAMYLNNLNNRFGDRYNRTGSMDDLQRAIAYAQEAVEATPLDHPDRAVCFYNLGDSFGVRHSRTGSIDDLEQAIVYGQKAVEATPLDHPRQALYLCSLGDSFCARYSQTGDKEDADIALRLFENGVKCSTSLPLHRISSGRFAIRVLHQYGQWKEAVAIAETLLHCLPRLCGRYLSRNDQQHALKQVSGFAAEACSLSLKIKNPREALQRIEFARALILGYLMDNRSDMSELALAYPYLAREYDELRSRAFCTVDVVGCNTFCDSRLQEQRNVPRLIEDCERRIRDKPGFDCFLQPASTDELMEAAGEGPIVIINCTYISSDAIVVFPTIVDVVPLSNMSLKPPKIFQDALEQHKTVGQRDYQRDVETDMSSQHDADLLSWLWWTCVKPILQKVAEHRAEKASDETPRIWWIGTGAASSLPFHAAGNYGYGTSNGSDNCLAQVISSYTSSIKSLRYARTTASRASRLFVEERSLLVVTMPTTPGHGALAGAALEGEAIREVTRQRWAVKSLAHPTASHVLEEIRTAKIVHFACHGSSDTADPMASHLLLQKKDGNKKSVDKLTISALLDASVQTHAWIAYLSACSTAEVKTQKLADESLHLTSAFQMVGFAHVIGSLRPADDQICVQVARLFYSFLVNVEDSIDLNRTVPEALNYAVRQISKDHPNNPSLWAPFIHLGA